MSPPPANEGTSSTTLSVLSLDTTATCASSPSPTAGDNTPHALPGTSSAFTSGIGTTVGPGGHATPTVSARRTGTGSYNLDLSGEDDPHVTVDTVPVPAGLGTTSATSTLTNKRPFDFDSATCAEDDAGKDTYTTANLNLDSFDIEMAPIGGAGTGGGHRRRRSSLMNPVGASSSSRHRSPRPRSSAGKGIDSDESRLVGEDTRVQEVARRDDRLSDDDLTDEDLHIDEEAGLTGADRRRKSRKRSRNTRLDQRIARDRITEAEKQEADKAVMKNAVINVTLILLWYFFSLSISLVSKQDPISGCYGCYGQREMLTVASTITSITSGCLTQTSSISDSHYLPPQHTCSCSFRWHPLFCSSFPRYDRQMGTSRIWASRGMSRSGQS